MTLLFLHESADDFGVVLGGATAEEGVRVLALLGLLGHLVLEELAVLAEALALLGRGGGQVAAQKVHAVLKADLLGPGLLSLVAAASATTTRVESVVPAVAAATLVVLGRVCGVGNAAKLLGQLGVFLEEFGQRRVTTLGLFFFFFSASVGRLRLIVVNLAVGLGARKRASFERC